MDKKEIVLNDQERERLGVLRKHEGVLGKGWVDALLGDEQNGEDGVYVSRFIDKGEGEKKRLVYFSTQEGDGHRIFKPEFEQPIPIDVFPGEVSYQFRDYAGGTVLSVTCIGPVEAFDVSKGGVYKDYQAVDDEAFMYLVNSGTMSCTVFIDLRTGKSGRTLGATMPLDPPERVTQDLGGVSMTYDLNEASGKPKHVRQVQRGVDGKLIVKEGYLSEDKVI